MQTSDQSAALPLSNKTTTIQSGPQHIINSGNTRTMETMNANYLGNDNVNTNSNGEGHGHTPLPMGHVLVSDPLAATAPLASDPGGSDPSSGQSQSQHMVHEPTHAHDHAHVHAHAIIAPLQNTSISESSVSSATAMSISRHDEWNRNRPTRESVLRRLSDALLRKSLTMVSYFTNIWKQENKCRILHWVSFQISKTITITIHFSFNKSSHPCPSINHCPILD